MSLLLALVSWLVSNLSKEYQGVINVPVIAESSIDVHSNVSSNSVMVSARCRTTGFRLVTARRAERGNPVKVVFDNSHLHHLSGDSWYISGSAKNSYVDRIFGKETTVDGFITDTLTFVFPSENHKKVPVNLVQSISFNPQYMAVNPVKIEPDSVVVYGESTRIENITEVSTVPLSLDQVDKDKHGSLRLSPVRGVRTSVQEVNYSLEVSRFVENVITVNMEMHGAPADERFSIFPSVAKVCSLCLTHERPGSFRQIHPLDRLQRLQVLAHWALCAPYGPPSFRSPGLQGGARSLRVP